MAAKGQAEQLRNQGKDVAAQLEQISQILGPLRPVVGDEEPSAESPGDQELSAESPDDQQARDEQPSDQTPRGELAGGAESASKDAAS